MDIKQLKPRKQSRYKQGYIDPKSCRKLIDKSRPIIYRSSWEKTFLSWLEASREVKSWNSECIPISYIYKDGTTHTYYPDYFVEFQDGRKCIVEIKPKSQTTRPLNENSWAWKEWTKNCCKWKAAMQWCQDHSMQFKIITENTINYLR